MTKLVAAARRLRDRCTLTYFGVKNFLARREEGATLVEYALLVALIAIACITAIAILGNDIKNAFTNIGTAIGGNT